MIAGVVVKRQADATYYTGRREPAWSPILRDACVYDTESEARRETSAAGWRVGALFFESLPTTRARSLAKEDARRPDEIVELRGERRPPEKLRRNAAPKRCSAEDLAAMYPPTAPRRALDEHDEIVDRR